MKSPSKVQLPNIISLVSLAVSVFAVLLSMYAISITKKQHVLERSLILLGKYNSENHRIIILPLDANMKLLRAKIYFPPSFSMMYDTVSSNGYVGDMSIFEVNSRHSIIGLHKSMKPGFVYQVQVPVVIDSYYATSGNSIVSS